MRGGIDCARWLQGLSQKADTLKDVKKLEGNKTGMVEWSWVDKPLKEKGCEIIDDVLH